MSWFINLLIAFLILGVQYFLSTRKRAFWGAILPICYISFLIYLKLFVLSGENTKDFWFIAILGTTILLSGWISGRESLKKKRKKELDKIEKKNL